MDSSETPKVSRTVGKEMIRYHFSNVGINNHILEHLLTDLSFGKQVVTTRDVRYFLIYSWKRVK